MRVPRFDWFINYYADARRPTAFNVGVARVLLGTIAIWRLRTTLPWGYLREWPVYVRPDNLFLLPSRAYLDLVPIEVNVCTVLLVAFTIGYRIGLTGFLSALLYAHLFGLVNLVSYLHASTFASPIVLLLLLFSFFSDTDALSIDTARQRWQWSINALNKRLQSTDSTEASLSTLRWSLVAFGCFYFLTGFSKFAYGPATAWVGNLPFLLHQYQLEHIPEQAVLRIALGDVLIGFGLAYLAAGIGTLLLEMGFLIVILMRKRITLVLIGLYGFLVAIVIALDPFFFELFLFPLLFLPWDDLHARLTREDSLDVIYDDGCFLCTWSLQPFRSIDLGSDLAFHPQSEGVAQFGLNARDVDKALWVFDAEGTGYRGYDGFRALLDHFRVLRPLGWLLNRTPVRFVGERVYAWVAANRNRIACSVN